jgi:purine operon repressor
LKISSFLFVFCGILSWTLKEEKMSEKVKRTERIAAITRILSCNPGKLFTLSDFAQMFGAAKSSMSEDISMIESAIRKYNLGTLETLTGAAGGVRLRNYNIGLDNYQEVEKVAQMLRDPERVLPGNFLYWSDILSDPQIMRQMGAILASEFEEEKPDAVLTMETKGIPLAMMVADALSVPLVIARRNSKVYEGSAVNINYVTGNGRIETMALARRSLKPRQKVLVADDFMQVGGTVGGMVALMAEFECPVIGIAVMIAQDNINRNSLPTHRSLLSYSGTVNGIPMVEPAAWLRPGGR